MRSFVIKLRAARQRPYLGRDDTRPASTFVPESVVLKVSLEGTKVLDCRSVTTDNYFTFVQLAEKLLSNKLMGNKLTVEGIE